MKYLTEYLMALLVAFACVFAGNPGYGATEADPLARKKAPIVLEGGTSPLLSVVFEHTAHRGIACLICHHDSSTDREYSTCRSEDCHITPGARERDPESLFMAFHARGEGSCYGCHAIRATADPLLYPQFRNCLPCHSGPEPAGP